MPSTSSFSSFLFSPFFSLLNIDFVSEVTDMAFMFNKAYDFDQDVNDWDVSRVTSMDAMFQLAFDFNQDINDWSVSSK